jgi:UDP-glucose 4-epimerase
MKSNLKSTKIENKYSTILVTGGMGYIGSHAVLDLIDSGYNVIVLDSLQNSNKNNLNSVAKNFEFIKGSIEDKILVSKIINKYKIKSVMHFAAFAYVGESIQNPIKYYSNNTSNSVYFIQTCIECGVKNFIFSSTCATYGVPQKLPISEKTPQHPINPYGQSKLMVEKVLSEVYNTHGLNSIIFRYFNAAGADSLLRTGEDHHPETHLIPLLLRSIFDPTFVFQINGNKYKTKDGTCIRDFIHVTDIARAHVQGLEKLLENDKYFNQFNLGNGKGFSIYEVIKVVEKVTGKKVNFRIGQSRPGDPPILISTANKVKKELKWKPIYTSLEKIVNSAYDFHKVKKNLKS